MAVLREDSQNLEPLLTSNFDRGYGSDGICTRADDGEVVGDEGREEEVFDVEFGVGMNSIPEVGAVFVLTEERSTIMLTRRLKTVAVDWRVLGCLA